MGWSYRKSVRVGPFRVNLSKSGVGYSVGAGGFRVGQSAKGRRYSSFTIPGTGMTYRPSKSSSGTGCMLLIPILLALSFALFKILW